MTETDDEVLGHLLHIRTTLDAVREDVRELRRPLAGLEHRYVSMSRRLDRIDSSIERIGRRLDLTDA